MSRSRRWLATLAQRGDQLTSGGRVGKHMETATFIRSNSCEGKCQFEYLCGVDINFEEENKETGQVYYLPN